MVLKIKTILVSQPEPKDKSPYHELAKNNNLQIDFRQFIKVEGIAPSKFRLTKVDLSTFSAVIFTSRKSIDHFFRLAKSLKMQISDDTKYFCINESIAFYLQKYIAYRKRKIFHGRIKFDDLLPMIIKHGDEKFIVPMSDVHKPEIPQKLAKAGIDAKIAVMYRTVSSDLSDLRDVNYDVLVFFSPSGIKSLMSNFPKFKQHDTKIASFGTATALAVSDAGLTLDIQAPSPQNPSMTMALESFISTYNRELKQTR